MTDPRDTQSEKMPRIPSFVIGFGCGVIVGMNALAIWLQL